MKNLKRVSLAMIFALILSGLVAWAQDEPYDVLLDDFEPEMKTAEVTRIFDEIKPELVQLIADLRERQVDDSFLRSDFDLDEQVALDYEVIDLFGHRPNTWRIDPTEHPLPPAGKKLTQLGEFVPAGVAETLSHGCEAQQPPS